jgi:hypothetical protein
MDLETMRKEAEVSWYEVLPRCLLGRTEDIHESLCQENIMYIITNFFQSVSVFQSSIVFSKHSSALPYGYNLWRSFNMFNDLFL